MKPQSVALEFCDRKLIRLAAEVMDDHPRYADADRAVGWVFDSAKENERTEQVLSKVCVLNSLYATSVYDVVRMAHHIVAIEDLDRMLDKGELNAVDSIRRGHGIHLSSGKDRDFYSFATKYCHFHSPERFPMWDTLVSELLYGWNKARAWLPNTSHESFRDYNRYHAIVTTARDELDPSASYKRFDMGLWIIGKYLYGSRFGAADEWVNSEVVERLALQENGKERRTP